MIDDVSLIDLNGMGVTCVSDIDRSALVGFDKTKGIALDETDLGDLGNLDKDLKKEYKKIRKILGQNDPMDVTNMEDESMLYSKLDLSNFRATEVENGD